MPFPGNIADIHTHDLHPAVPSVINIDPAEISLSHPALPQIPEGSFFSLGIHPQHATETYISTALLNLRHLATANPDAVIAIGEAGLDRTLPSTLDAQAPVFIAQARLAQELSLPLIIHCVRAFDRLLAIRKAMRPTVPWIVHGFRGKPALARQLLNAGLLLSFGHRHNADSLAITPEPLHESDTPPLQHSH